MGTEGLRLRTSWSSLGKLNMTTKLLVCMVLTLIIIGTAIVVNKVKTEESKNLAIKAVSEAYGLKEAQKYIDPTNDRWKPITSEIPNQQIPECYLGICPAYQSLDVDGDGQAESVAVVPTRMTKGAGRVWVIKRGKVIFISQEYAEIGVKWLETNNGFILIHQELLPLGELGPVIEQKYVFRNGTFVPET